MAGLDCHLWDNNVPTCTSRTCVRCCLSLMIVGGFCFQNFQKKFWIEYNIVLSKFQKKYNKQHNVSHNSKVTWYKQMFCCFSMAIETSVYSSTALLSIHKHQQMVTIKYTVVWLHSSSHVLHQLFPLLLHHSLPLQMPRPASSTVLRVWSISGHVSHPLPLQTNRGQTDL